MLLIQSDCGVNQSRDDRAVLSYLAIVAHQPLRRRVYGMKYHELRNPRASCHDQIHIVQAQLVYVPAPKTLAVFDSLLYTVAEVLVPEAA